MSELEDKYGIYDIDADGVFPTPQKYLAAREITPSTDFEALGKAYANAYKNYAKASGFPEWQQDAYADDLATTYFSGVVNKEAFDANYAARTGTAPPTPAQPPVQDRGRRIALDGSQNGIPESNYNLLSEMNPSAYPALPDTDPSLWQSVKRGALGMVAGLEASSAAEGYSNAEKLQSWAPGLADLNRTLAGGSESRAVDLVRAQSTIPSHPGLAEFAKTQGLIDATGFLVTNPAATANLFAESAPQMVPQIGASMAAGSRAGLPGAIAAGFGTSYELNQASKTLEELQASGKSLPAALQDPTIRDPATSAASRYALPVAAAESIGLGLAAKAPLTLGSVATQALAVQPASAGLGEVGGQLAAHPDKPVTWRDVAAEIVLEVPFGATETMVHAGKYGTAAPPAAGQPPPTADPNAGVGNTADPNVPTGPSADPFDAARNATRQARTAATQEAASQNAAQAEQDMQTLNALMARTPAIRQGAEAQTKLEAEIAALEQQQAMDAQLGLGETQQVKDAAKALVAKQKELAKLGDQRAALKQMEGLQGQIESRTQGGGLSAIIASGEGDYGSFNRGVAGDARGAKLDFATMTVGELQRRQALPAGHPDRIFAWGKYQIIPDTMTGAVKNLGLDPNTPVTPQLQEQIYQRYLTRDKQPAMRDYIEGKHSDLHAAQDALAGEWASIADPDTGRSRYGDRGGNKASISAGQAATGLIAARKIYADSIAQGLSPEVAWARAVGTGNVAGALPAQAQPHPDDVYLVDRAGNATMQPFKPISNPTTDEAQAGVEPFKPISNPTTAEPTTGTQPIQQPTGAAPTVKQPLPDAFQDAKPLQPYVDEPLTTKVDSLLGARVDYGGIQGTLRKDDSGLYVGDTLVESGLSGVSAEELGLKKITPRALDIGAARDQAAAEKAKNTPVTDWSQNLVSLRGEQYTYVTSNSDADGKTLSITATDANGKTVTIRNPDVVAGIESHKIAYELETAHDARKQWEAIHATESDPAIRAGVAEPGAVAAGDTQQTASSAVTPEAASYAAPKLYTATGKLANKQPTQEETDAAVAAFNASGKLTKRQQQIVDAVTAAPKPIAPPQVAAALDAHVPDAAIDQDPELPNVTPTENVTDPNGANNAKPSGSPEPAGAATDAGRGNNMGDGTGATSQADDVQTGETSSTNGDVVDGQQTQPVDAPVQQAVVDPVTANVRADVEPITDTATAIDEAVWDADPPLSHLAESALYEVFGGGKPKTAQAVQTALRSFFRENYDGRGTEATFIAKHMKELRDSKAQESSVLDKLTKAYLGDDTDGPRLHLRNSILAWHGSPHKFDTFTTDKMGDGEGDQVYGWGLYFASDIAVADYYRGKDRASSALYSVSIPEDSYIGWDTNIAEQPDTVQPVLEALIAAYPDVLSRDMDGSELYEGLADVLGGQEAASKMLAAKGVTGITYVEGLGYDGLVDAKPSSTGYVVFDAEAIKILDRFRLTTAAAGGVVIPEDKATTAVQRILGDVPFEPMPADAPTVEGKAVLGMVRNGKIYIDTKNMATVAEAEAVAIEELSHLGIQNLFGNQYTAKLKELFNGIGGRQGIEKFLQRSGVTMDDTYRSMEDVTLMDEALAHLAANKASLPVRAKRAFQQFIGYLRNVIRKYRTTALHNVVDSDLVYVASRARKAGKAGKKVASAAKPKPDTTPIRLHIRDPRQAASEAADEQLRQAHANRERGVDWNKIRAGTTTAGIWEAANQHLKNLGFKYEAAKKWSNNNLRTDHGMAQAIAVLQGVDIGWASRAKPKELRDLLFGNETARDVKSEARKVTDIKRKLTWDKSAVHAKTEDDIRKMEFWISQEYGKPVTKLTDAERAAISERIRTATPADPVAYAYRYAVDTSSEQIIQRLYTEMQTRINELNEAGREAFDDRADELADPEVNVENLPPALQRIAALKRQTDMIKANLGSYMHRSYTAFHDPDWARKAMGSPEYHAAVEATMRNNEGMTKEKATTSINKLIDDIAGGVYDGLVGFAATGSKDHSILRKRKLDDQPEIRALLGEITDPRYNYAYTMNSMAEFVASHIYQEQLRTAGLALGFFTKEADGAFVTQFPQNKAWSMLSDVYTTRDVMDALESMNPLGAPEYRRIVWATSKVKKYKTIYSPTTAFRNLWSGALLLLQTGHMPFGKMGDAWDTLKNGTSYFGVSLIDPTNGGIRIADKEAQAMLAELARLGIIHNGAQSQDLLQLFNDVQTMDQQLKGRGWFGRNIEDRAVEFYRFGDDFYKMIHFFKETDDLVKSGLSPQQAKELAAKRTVDMMPSYDRIPRGLQQLRRFPLMGTFVSFPWEVVRTTKNVVYHALEDKAAKRYGMAAKKMLGLALAQGGLQGLVITTMNAMLAGVDEEDDKLVNTLSPDWAKHQMRLYLGNEDGRVEFTNWSAIVPSDYMWKSARAAWEKGNTDGIYAGALAGFYATAAPFASEDLTFSTVGEILDNRAKDSGIPIYGKGKTFNDVFNDPEVTWRAASHLLFKLGPGVFNNARDFAVANSTDAGEDAAWWNFLAESRGGKVSASGKTFTNLDATMALFGFRTTTLDMDILTEKASADAKTRLTYARADLRQKMDQSTALSDGAVQNAADRYLAERAKAVRPALAAIHYHKGEGKTISEIKKLLHAEVGTTLNEDEIDALVAGKMPSAALDKEALAGMKTRAFRALDNSDGPNKYRAQQAINARLNELNQYLKAKGSQSLN